MLNVKLNLHELIPISIHITTLATLQLDNQSRVFFGSSFSQKKTKETAVKAWSLSPVSSGSTTPLFHLFSVYVL
jgi:hypothetical protein